MHMVIYFTSLTCLAIMAIGLLIDPLMISGPRVSKAPEANRETCTLPPSLSLASKTVTCDGKTQCFSTTGQHFMIAHVAKPHLIMHVVDLITPQNGDSM